MTWLCLCQRCEPATVRSHCVCVEVWSRSAVAAWLGVQSAEWSASILKGLFLSVSDPLLPDCHQQRQSAAGAPPVWTITKALCRRHKSLFVRETNWEGGCGVVVGGEGVCWATLPAVLLFAVVSSGFVCVLLQLVGESWGHNVWLSHQNHNTWYLNKCCLSASGFCQCCQSLLHYSRFLMLQSWTV